MFDIGGYELILLAAVAILVVGPRELPGMLRSVGKFVGQARKMTSNVQKQFNQALKEAELDDVKKTIDDVRSLNPASQIKKTIANELKPLTDVGNSVKGAVGDAKTMATDTAKSVEPGETPPNKPPHQHTSTAGSPSAEPRVSTLTSVADAKPAPVAQPAPAQPAADPAATPEPSQKASSTDG